MQNSDATHYGAWKATGAIMIDVGKQPERQDILGIGVSAIDMGRAVETIQRWIDRDERRYVCVTSVHGVMVSQASAELREIHNEAGMVTPDGMPLAWLLRLSGHPTARRVCGPELMPAVFVASQARGDRHFLYGATEATLARLRAGLLAQAPDATIVGSYAPPFRPLTAAEDAEITSIINDARPDVVWVGLSTPKQERWMSSHRDQLTAPVLIGVGAAFDVHAGLSTRAPRVMQICGLEWLYRVAHEPRRLWWRYFWNNPRFVALIALQKSGLYRPGVT